MEKNKNKPTRLNFFMSLFAVLGWTIIFLVSFVVSISLFARALLLDLSPTGRFTLTVFGLIIFRVAWFAAWAWWQFLTRAKTVYRQLHDADEEERRIEHLIEHHESETEIMEQNYLEEKQDDSL